MCWPAIVDGAIQARTLFRMAQHLTNTPESVTRTRSSDDDASVNLQDDARVSDALIAIEQIHLAAMPEPVRDQQA